MFTILGELHISWVTLLNNDNNYENIDLLLISRWGPNWFNLETLLKIFML